MKISALLLTAVVVECSAKVVPPRKISLFVRTGEVAKDKVYVDRQPLFGSAGGPVPMLASSLSSGGLNPPQKSGGAAGGVAGGADCHPKCTWSCGNAECDEVCEPVCAPPQCETACAMINVATCQQKCGPPKCAIVCPTSLCSHGGCPGCKTICAPPKCTAMCSTANCESKCSEPQCTWKCNPGKCEKPRCSLTCGGAKTCGLDGNLNARPPPFGEGMTVLAKGLAAVDPKSLSAFAAKGGSPGAKGMGAPSGAPGPAPAASGPIR